MQLNSTHIIEKEPNRRIQIRNGILEAHQPRKGCW